MNGLIYTDGHVAMSPSTATEPSGSWDSIHVFETAERGRQAHYKLTSTIMLQLTTKRSSEGEGEAEKTGGSPDSWKRNGEVTLSGSMTRQVCHVHNLLLTYQTFVID